MGNEKEICRFSWIEILSNFVARIRQQMRVSPYEAHPPQQILGNLPVSWHVDPIGALQNLMPGSIFVFRQV
jgi:hypothetical protein